MSEVIRRAEELQTEQAKLAAAKHTQNTLNDWMLDRSMRRCREALRSEELKNSVSTLILIAVLTVTYRFRKELGEDRAAVYRNAYAKISAESGPTLAHKILGGLE